MGLLEQISSDRTTFLSDNDFAVEVTYTPDGGDATTIEGIFDDEYKARDTATGEVETTPPQIIVATRDVLNAAHGDTIIKSGVTYNIIGIHKDGTGMTTLILSRD